VSVVDGGGAPGVSAGSVGEHGHGALLKGVGQAAVSAGSSPAGDGARLSSEVASVGGSHCGVAGVGVGGDVGEANDSDVVGESRVAVVGVVGMPGE